MTAGMPYDPGLAVQPATGEIRVRRPAAVYEQDPVGRYEPRLLGWSLGFYACYFVAVAGLVPMWAMLVPGVVCFLRYFNNAHESLHADMRGSGRHPARRLIVVVGPIYLGYDELRELHFAHHREVDSPSDPDRGMLYSSPWRTLLGCLVQPEQYVLAYIRRNGLRPRLAAAMATRAVVYAALMWLGGWPGALLYNLMTRIGNTAAFFVFSWWVHRPEHYQLRPPRFPAAVGAAWALLFGRECLRGIRFHYLHHRFPHVPDRHLPALSHEVMGMPGMSPR